MNICLLLISVDASVGVHTVCGYEVSSASERGREGDRERESERERERERARESMGVNRRRPCQVMIQTQPLGEGGRERGRER